MHQITAVIPTYNRAALLRRSIDSVLCQTAPPDQIVVVDDGSTDDTEDVCREYEGLVEYARQSNSGASSARNLGIRLSRHPWVAFLDSDDYWVDTHLERVGAAIRATSGTAELYFSDMQMPEVDGGGTLWQQVDFCPTSPHEMVADASTWALMKRQPMMLQTSVIRRSTLIELGGLDPQFRLIHDSYLFCQLGIGGSACAVAAVGCVQTSDDESAVRLTTAIPLDSEGKLREGGVMWELIYKQAPVPSPLRKLVRFNLAASHWGLAKCDARAGRYGPALGHLLRTIATDPRLAWWMLLHRSLHGYEHTVAPNRRAADRTYDIVV